MHQSTSPNARVANMRFETASVRPSRQHFNSCGTKLDVDMQPAMRPISVGREPASMWSALASDSAMGAQLQHQDGSTQEKAESIENCNRHTADHGPVDNPQGESSS